MKKLILYFLIFLLPASFSWAAETNLKKIFSEGSLREFSADAPGSYDFSKYKKNLFYTWASWCPSCKAETLKFLKQYEKLKSCPNVGVAAINTDKNHNVAVRKIAEWKLGELHMYRDETGVLKNYVKGGIPKLIITDGKGEILKTHVGASSIHVAVSKILKTRVVDGGCKN